MNSPDVSVVLPTYNREEVIERAVQSALSQTYPVSDILVVDDGSTDDTESRVRGIDDPKVKLIKHSGNKGGAAARNTGIRQAGGDYISFLDSDDEYLPEKVERQVEYLESRSDEWVAAYCNVQSVEDDPALLETIANAVVSGPKNYAGLEGGDELIKYVLMGQFTTGGASTLLVDADVVDQLSGFDESFQRHQDVEFLVRLLETGKLAHVDEELVVKHQTPPPSAATVRQAKERFLQKFNDKIERLETEGYHIRRTHKIYLAEMHFQEGDFKRGLQYTREARIHSIDEFLRLSKAIAAGIIK